MINSPVIKMTVVGSMLLAITQFAVANPVLSTTEWTNITPSFLKGTSFQTCLISIDHGNHDNLYLTGSFGNKLGLLKSINTV